jgi:hypothetical protein
MPAAANDSMSANIRLVTMTISWIGSDFADSDPDTLTTKRTSARITQHSSSARNTVAANRLGSGRFCRRSRIAMGDARDRGRSTGRPPGTPATIRRGARDRLEDCA